MGVHHTSLKCLKPLSLNTLLAKLFSFSFCIVSTPSHSLSLLFCCCVNCICLCPPKTLTLKSTLSLVTTGNYVTENRAKFNYILHLRRFCILNTETIGVCIDHKKMCFLSSMPPNKVPLFFMCHLRYISHYKKFRSHLKVMERQMQILCLFWKGN